MTEEQQEKAPTQGPMPCSDCMMRNLDPGPYKERKYCDLHDPKKVTP